MQAGFSYFFDWFLLSPCCMPSTSFIRFTSVYYPIKGDRNWGHTSYVLACTQQPFIRYSSLVQGWTNLFLNSTWHRLNKLQETFLRSLLHLDMTATIVSCQFVSCTSMIRLSCSTKPQRCSIRLKSGDSGGHLSNMFKKPIWVILALWGDVFTQEMGTLWPLIATHKQAVGV